MNVNTPVIYSHYLRFYQHYGDELSTVKYDSQADYPEEYKTGSFPITIKDQDKMGEMSCNLYGRGNEKYLIEPHYLSKRYARILPSYEVTVTVAIKMKGVDEPLYYVRKYLSEIKQFELGNTKVNYSRSMEQYEKIKNDPLRKGHTAQLDIQMQHYKNVLLAFRPEFEKQEAYYFTPRYFTMGNETNPLNLFDGNVSTNCRCSVTNKKYGEWVWIFESSRLITPKYYALTSSSEAEEHWNTTNPKIWALYAMSKKGEWVRLDARDSEHVFEEKMPDGNSKRKVYECRWNPGEYQEFKFVVRKAWTSENKLVYWLSKDSGYLELAEFEILESLDEQ